MEKSNPVTMTHEEAQRLFALWKANKDDTFPDRAIRQLDKLIWELVWDYRTYAEKYADDMYQEGALAVLQKLGNWNPSFALSTYFTPFIKGAIYAFIANIRGVNKNDMNKNYRIVRASGDLMEQGIEPTVENIARYIGDPVNFTREVIAKNLDIMSRSQTMIHIDGPKENPKGDHADSMLDIFRQETLTPELAYELKEKQEIVQEALAKLPEIEKNIIISLFVDENTLKQTAENLSTNEVMVKRLRTKALDTLKRSPILRTYLNLVEPDDNFEISFTEFDNFQEYRDDDSDIFVFGI